MMKVHKKKTKIIATISDLRCDVEFIQSLYDAGMDVARLNTAHQSLEDSLRIINNIRQVSDAIPIIIDTKGPEIRTAPMEEKVAVKKDMIIKVSGNQKGNTTADHLYVNYANFTAEVPVGSTVLIDDGELGMEVIDKSNDVLTCKFLNDGELKGKKSVNVPNVTFNLPALTDKDRQYVEFAAQHDVDFIAHSFVRGKNDLLEIQEILNKNNSQAKIIAKIENQEGVDNIDEILEYAYGVMVARGDLGIEIPYEQIPSIQKFLINKCINRRKPVIVATQMLHSMIKNPRPTRAEASDIAAAVYSKTDALMLSGETTHGDYPIEAVLTMAKIARESEKIIKDIHDTPIRVMSTETSAYLSKSAVEAAIKLDAKVIIADTTTGRTIRNMSGFRGKKIIYTVCYNKRVMRELALSYGIYTAYIEPHSQFDFDTFALKDLLKNNEISSDDQIVVLGGNMNTTHGASFILISSVDELLTFAPEHVNYQI